MAGKDLPRPLANAADASIPPSGDQTLTREEPAVITTADDGSFVDNVIRFFTRTPASTTFGSPRIGVFSEAKPDDPIEVGDLLRITYRLPFPFLLDWQKD